MKTARTLSNQLILGMLVLLLFSSCEKDGDPTGEGNYIYAINNLTNVGHEYNIYLDGKYIGEIVAESGKIVNATNFCSNIPFAETNENVIVIKNVSSGEHILKIVDEESLDILHVENFTMTDKGCLCQPFTMM
ncbi:MAG: hypothetical protein WBA61_16800 [Aequorivita sp.]